jgi:hypothetical protein
MRGFQKHFFGTGFELEVERSNPDLGFLDRSPSLFVKCQALTPSPPSPAAGISIEAVRSREGVMHSASKMYMGKTIEGFSGVGRFWGVFNRGKLPLSKAVRVEIAQPVLVHFQRIARRFIQSQMKASFLWKRTLGKRVRWRRYRCGKPARVLVGDPVQGLRVGEWAEGEFWRRSKAAGLPY